MTVAPWPDYFGRSIHAGDTIRHPDGLAGTVVFEPKGATPHDQWLVRYVDRSTLSRLCLQVGEKGQAIVDVREATP